MPETEEPLSIEHTNHGNSSIVRPIGALNVDTYPMLRDSLLKYAAETPDAVIIALDFLRIEGERLLTVFSLVWMRVADWPGVPIILVAEDEPRRRQLRRSVVARYMPIHADVAAALAALDEPPVRRRMHSTLYETTTAPSRARALTRQACDQWGIDELTSDTELVATELVENALKHTNSHPSLRLDLRRGILSVAVTDDSPTPAAQRELTEHRDGGYGLRAVAQLSRVWGCTPTLAGGKVVWATLGRANTGHGPTVATGSTG